MPVAHIHGQVTPASLKLTINNHPSVDWYDRDFGKVRFHLKIENGDIDIGCEVENFDIARHGAAVVDRALEMARLTVDMAGFSLGVGFNIHLEEIVDPSGASYVLNYKDNKLAVLCTAYTMSSPDFEEVYRRLVETPVMMFAVHDLALALTRRSHMAVYCTRAIEALREYFDPDARDRNPGWTALRSNLNISLLYLKFVTDLSIGPRHASLTPVSGTISSEALQRTWTIMNRYFEFLKRGKAPLPLSEFPQL